jgi:uncharacterized membrane protein
LNTNDILNNPLVTFAIILGVLTILAGISFFTAVSAGLTSAVTMGVSLFGLVVVLWLFGSKGPLKA